MYDYHHKKLPEVFDSFFTKVHEVHSYNTRLASKSSFALPKARTNFGKFNIRFNGSKVWNSIPSDVKMLSKLSYKKVMKNTLLSNYI